MKRVIVVGAGITGLSAAYALRKADPSLDVVIIEASERVGGALRSECTDGYVIERGPDSILTAKPAALELAAELGLEGSIVRTRAENRGAYVVHRGRLERVPDGFFVVAPSDLLALARSPILSVRGKLRAAIDLALPKRVKEDESLGHFVERRFGAELLDRLAQPLAGGIYGADPYRLSLRSTMPRFLDAEAQSRSVTLGMMKGSAEEGSKSGARYGMFISFDRGVEVLPATLASHVQDTIRFNTSVIGIDVSGGGSRVHTSEGTLPADGVVVAQSARVAAPWFTDSPSVSRALRSIRFGSAATATFAWRREEIPHALDASGFVVPAIEGRLVLASTWASAKWPGRAPDGYELIRVFLGGNDRDEAVHYSDAELAREALHDLRDLMGIRAKPRLQRVDRYPQLMPRYDVGHRARVETLLTDVRKLGNIALAGSSYRGVGIPDAIAQGQDAARSVLARL